MTIWSVRLYDSTSGSASRRRHRLRLPPRPSVKLQSSDSRAGMTMTVGSKSKDASIATALPCGRAPAFQALIYWEGKELPFDPTICPAALPPPGRPAAPSERWAQQRDLPCPPRDCFDHDMLPATRTLLFSSRSCHSLGRPWTRVIAAQKWRRMQNRHWHTHTGSGGRARAALCTDWRQC